MRTDAAAATAVPWTAPRGRRRGRRRAQADRLGALPAGARAAGAVHRLGPGGAARLHQADPAADAVGHARRAVHRPGRRAAAARLRRHGAAHARGLPDRRRRRRAAGRAARQQREGLPQRRVPDRLLPLDAVVGADPAVPADLRRLRHQQGGDRRLRRAADRPLQQRLRRDQRAQAAGDGGAG